MDEKYSCNIGVCQPNSNYNFSYHVDPMEQVEAIIIGAGVVGLAVAKQLSAKLENILIVEKNNSFGEETSSRNSEVIHAGLYYPKGSLKAKLCVDGKNKLYRYCQLRHIPHQRLGKLLVAHNVQEEKLLRDTLKIAIDNDVNDLSWVDVNDLTVTHPELSATAALLSPSTGIIDVHIYMQSLLADIEHNGGLFIAQTRMLGAKPSENGFIVSLDSQGEQIEITTKYLINCGGLHSTTIANNIEAMPAGLIPTLHYCRGHYFSYQGKSPFQQLIYPVPSANGLGIHASLDIGGQLKFGPDTQYIDEIEYSVDESLKEKFVKAIKCYFPNIDTDKLQPAYSGVRPKLQGPDDEFKDFIIQFEHEHNIKGLVNLFGIDSPGLTSSLAIADYVVEKLKL